MLVSTPHTRWGRGGGGDRRGLVFTVDFGYFVNTLGVYFLEAV